MIDEKRKDIIRMRENWMRERATSHDKQAVEEEYGASNTGEVISRIADRLSDRLREELTDEIQKKVDVQKKREKIKHSRAEQFLAEEIETHICPICYELMVPPDHNPILLFPCGHSFCKTCLKHLSGGFKSIKCPYCRTEIKSNAPNISLQNIISNYVKKRDTRGISSKVDSMEDMDDSFRRDNSGSYEGQKKMLEVRCDILTNEIIDTRKELNGIKEKLNRAKVVTEHLEAEERKLNETLDQIVKEIEIIHEQQREQLQRVRTLKEEDSQAERRLEFVQDTLDALTLQKEKVELLLQ